MTGKCVCSNPGLPDLPGAERDDAANRIVGRDANGDSIPGNDLDSEASHPAAQLCENFVSGVALHSIQSAGVDRHDGPLHIYQVVFAQQLILSRFQQSVCHAAPHGATV